MEGKENEISEKVFVFSYRFNVSIIFNSKLKINSEEFVKCRTSDGIVFPKHFYSPASPPPRDLTESRRIMMIVAVHSFKFRLLNIR